MTRDEWLKKAKKLRETCEDEIANKNGGTKCTDKQATEMQQLGIEIGSKHGRHPAPYKNLKDSLDESIGWVSGGKKDEFFSDTKKAKK